MCEAGYVRVRNWERFQQYKDREPRWIKLYRSLNHNYEWCRLSETGRAHLIGIWLLAAETDNKIPSDAAWIGAQICAKSEVDLDELLTLNFIEVYGSVQNCTELYIEKSRVEKSRVEKSRVEHAPAKKQRSVFTPPTITEVDDYRREINARIDPEAFVDYYESKGWLVGKTKMKDWKAAVRNWARRDAESNTAKRGTAGGGYTGMTSEF